MIKQSNCSVSTAGNQQRSASFVACQTRDTAFGTGGNILKEGKSVRQPPIIVSPIPELASL